MENAPKPYYPGFRDMSLIGAFALTFLFFLGIWVAVVAMRLIGLRRRVVELEEIVRRADTQLLEAREHVGTSELQELESAIQLAREDHKKSSAELNRLVTEQPTATIARLLSVKRTDP